MKLNAYSLYCGDIEKHTNTVQYVSFINISSQKLLKFIKNVRSSSAVFRATFTASQAIFTGINLGSKNSPVPRHTLQPLPSSPATPPLSPLDGSLSSNTSVHLAHYFWGFLGHEPCPCPCVTTLLSSTLSLRTNMSFRFLDFFTRTHFKTHNGKTHRWTLFEKTAIHLFNSFRIYCIKLFKYTNIKTLFIISTSRLYYYNLHRVKLYLLMT